MGQNGSRGRSLREAVGHSRWRRKGGRDVVRGAVDRRRGGSGCRRYCEGEDLTIRHCEDEDLTIRHCEGEDLTIRHSEGEDLTMSKAITVRVKT